MTDECSLCLFSLVQMWESLWKKRKENRICLTQSRVRLCSLCKRIVWQGRGDLLSRWLVTAALTGDPAHSELPGQPLEPSEAEPIGHTGPPEWTWAPMSSLQEAGVALGAIPAKTGGKAALAPPWATACWIFTYGQLVFLYWWKVI